jgi:hypothetical protein
LRRLPLLAAAIVALLPVTLLSTTGSASATSGKLTVKTYDRAGRVFSTRVEVQNLTTGQQWTIKSFTPKTLKKGTYLVITDMWNPSDGGGLGTDTLGAKVVKVSASSVSTTIDARLGKAVRVGLDRSPGAGYEQTVRAAICPANGLSIHSGAWNYPGKLFVIPNGSKHLRLAYSSIWENLGGGDLWMVAGSTKTKVPAGVNRTFKTSTLATLTAGVRRGPAGGDLAQIRFEENNDCHPGFGGNAFNGQTPGVARIHATAGRWQLDTDWSGQTKGGGTESIGYDRRKVTLAAGKRYGQTLFAAAWGPGYHVPELTGTKLRFETAGMFTQAGNLSATEDGRRSLVTLYDSKRHVVKKQWRTDGFTAKITTKGWYTLQVDARRYRAGLVYPADLLSPTAQAIFRMKLDPKAKSRVADVLLPRLLPAGLNLRNQGKAAGTTIVQIKPDRHTWNSDLVFAKVTPKSVTLQASYDGGRTWRTMPVRKTGGTWQATVRNPASGAVALRSRITTTKGAYAQVTIARAYTVG